VPTRPRPFGSRAIRELKQFQELVKRNCAELAYCEGIAVSTKHFAFSKLPVFSTKVTERFKINPDPIGKDGGATRHQLSPTGETVTYTAQAAELDYRWKVTNTAQKSWNTRSNGGANSSTKCRCCKVYACLRRRAAGL